jgi:hypothetical protein
LFTAEAKETGPGIEFKLQDKKIFTPRLLSAPCISAVDSGYSKQVPFWLQGGLLIIHGAQKIAAPCIKMDLD